MNSVQIHEVISKIISFFYRIGFWHRGDEPTIRELRIKSFYCCYFFLFFLSLMVGAITNKIAGDRIFLAEIAVVVAILSVKVCFIIWKQNQIQELLNRICTFSIRDHDDYTFVYKKLDKFIKFVNVLSLAVLTICVCNLVIPFIGGDGNLLLKIAFPLDWKNNNFGFCLAFAFIFTENLIANVTYLFSVIIWYLLINCSLRYEVLGNELRKMGSIIKENKKKKSEKEKQDIFLQDLEASIDAHQNIKELINELDTFCSNLFFAQIGTGGLCICCSIYCLAFASDNIVEFIVHPLTLFYNISDIFMITYFGNEIMLSSNRLSYSLFESDWVDQPQKTKKCIIIFGEYLKQPHQLIVGKLYPLTLDTFTRILKSAYNMFNILKNAAKLNGWKL